VASSGENRSFGVLALPVARVDLVTSVHSFRDNSSATSSFSLQYRVHNFVANLEERRSCCTRAAFVVLPPAPAPSTSTRRRLLINPAAISRVRGDFFTYNRAQIPHSGRSAPALAQHTGGNLLLPAGGPIFFGRRRPIHSKGARTSAASAPIGPHVRL
jgi:hypothetical protein